MSRPEPANGGETTNTTILFTDVEGSTDLRTRLGDEAANRVLADCERSVRDAVEANGGEVVKQLGDGVMATFQSARAAVLAAVDVQARTARDGPRVRVGVHFGEVAREGGDLQGAAVHAAARIMASAAGGQVLISERARDMAGLLPEGTRLIDRGLFWLKGFPERWRLVEVLGESADEGVVASAGGAPYVGRDDELADLRRALEAADGGHGSLVMIGGEPGVGKTRLAEETAAFARRRGMLVFTGRCSDMEGAPPYLPFVEILEAVARFVPLDALRAALGETAGDVARVVPELRRLLPDLPPAADLPPEQERRYLLNAVRDVLARSARMHALVLILDDLHWADEPSLLLLEHLAELLPELPCLVVGTYRDVELEVARPLARTLESLLRRKLAARVSLHRLSEDAVRELLAAHAGQHPPEGLVKVVFAETEGNPFFVEEVFRHLAEEGRLFDESGRFRTDLEISEVDVPEGVRLVIGRRLDRLSEAAREALTAGAVLGRVFPFALLATVAERENEELLDAIDEAERAKLLAPAGHGRDERYAFSHELVRQTLLAGVTSARRRRLHLRAAEAIEAAHGESPEHAADVAHHLLTAGATADPARTVRWLRMAGERALEAAAFEDAARHLEAALELETGLDDAAEADLRFSLGIAQRGAGRWEDALATWMDTLGRFRALGERERLAEVAWHVGYQLLWAGREEVLAQVLTEALVDLEGSDSAGHARLLLGAAVGFATVAQLAGSELMLGKAEAMAGTLNDDVLNRDLDQARAVVHWTFPGLAECITAARRAEVRMEAAGALWDLANIRSFIVAAQILSGEVEEAIALGGPTLELADRLGHVGAHIYVSRALDPTRAQTSGDAKGLLVSMESEATLAHDAGIVWAESNAVWHCAIAELWLGHWDDALARGRDGMTRKIPAGYEGWGDGVLAVILALAGPREEAVAWIEARLDRVPTPGERGTIGAWMLALFLTEALAVVGNWDRLASLAPVMEGLPATGIAYRVIDTRSAKVSLGLVAAARGDAEGARAAFEETVADADRRGFVIEGAETRRLYALALARLGIEPERAAALRAEAAVRYRELGMDRHAALVSG